MLTLRISETELAKDVLAVLAKVQLGNEVIVERDHQAVAVITAPQRSARPIHEILADARQRNVTVTLDDDFSTDMKDIIAIGQQPWNPPSWD